MVQFVFNKIIKVEIIIRRFKKQLLSFTTWKTIPVSTNPTGWGFGQRGLVGGVSAHGRAVRIRVPSNPVQSVILSLWRQLQYSTWNFILYQLSVFGYLLALFSILPFLSEIKNMHFTNFSNLIVMCTFKKVVNSLLIDKKNIIQGLIAHYRWF